MKKSGDIVFVVAAHPDDEVLGIGGTILKHVKNNDSVFILLLGDGENSRSQKADVKKRAHQAQKVSKSLGVQKLFLENLPDNQFDSVSLLSIVKLVEKYVNQVQPTTVYTHHAHDLNIDHQITFQAVLACCRPQPNKSVRKIATFETLSSTEWQQKTETYAFTPNEYVNITDFIDKKVAIFSQYRDEVRKYPHPRSREGIKILAKRRGMEVGFEYAEALQIIRSLEK